MFWIIPAWLVSLIASFYLGKYLRKLEKKIEVLEKKIETKVSKKSEVAEPSSEVIDILDPVKEAMYEHDQLMKRLNPDE